MEWGSGESTVTGIYLSDFVFTAQLLKQVWNFCILRDHEYFNFSVLLFPITRIIASPTSKEERVDKPVRTLSETTRVLSSVLAELWIHMNVSFRYNLQVPVAQIGSTNFRIQQAKHFAIAQAQQDGCTGNFRIFDSPFGNYFVPVVPTRKDLAA